MRKLEFASLQVRDLLASRDFYTSKLGFKLSDMPNPDAYIFKFKNGEASFAIRKPIADLNGKEVGIGASLWFAIDEGIEVFHQNLIKNEVPVFGGINNTPFGKTVIVKDPDGYLLTFLEMK